MMNKSDAENLFASMLHRWMTGDISNFERDYSENIEVDFDGDILRLQDLKKRTLFFCKNFEILESKIEDFIYDEGMLAVRIFYKIKHKQTGELIADMFYWFYELKNNQVQRYWEYDQSLFWF